MQTFEFTEADTREAIALANRLLPLLNGVPRVKCEVALLIAYTNVAEGCDRYPETTKADRKFMVASRGSVALTKIVEDVAGIPDFTLRGSTH